MDRSAETQFFDPGIEVLSCVAAEQEKRDHVGLNLEQEISEGERPEYQDHRQRENGVSVAEF